MMKRRVFSPAEKLYVLLFLISGLTFTVIGNSVQDVSALTCTFDNDLCGWTQDDTDDFDWIRNQGPTPTEGTGPSRDHTNGDGYYMYSCSAYHQNQITRLKSPEIKFDNSVCLTFWYHMHGGDMGALSVYKKEENSERKVFEIKGDGENQWKRALIEFQYNVPFQIVIEAKVGETFYEKGDVAIDDINGISCHLDCAFDDGICAWRNDYGTRSWAIQTEEIDRSIYIFKKAVENATARIKSTMQDPERICMSILHRITGSKTNSLDVFIGPGQNEKNDKLIRSISKSNNQDLEKAHIQINTTEVYRVLLVGRASPGAAENVYIYDITISKGNCPKDCNSNPCFNGASCKQTIDVTYKCECLDGWTGQHCKDITTTTTAVTETSASNGSTNSNGEQGGIPEDSKSLMMYIVIPAAGGGLVLIVSIVVCLLVLRRNRRRKQRHEGENNRPGQLDNPNAMADLNEHYEVVYKQPDAVNIGGYSKFRSQNESEYSEAHYMHTGNIPVTKSDEENVYNHLNQANIESSIVDQTYSHIPSAKPKSTDRKQNHNKNSIEDENYDVLETAKNNTSNDKTTQGACVLEGEYDHV